MKKVLIIGSGGREHAIVWAIRKSSLTPVEIYCAPGNAGIAQEARVVNIPVNDHPALAKFAEAEGIDLTFVGPEAPLAGGMVDLFAANGLRIVGPTAAAARLEGSKVFDLYQAGRLDLIREYNLNDVRVTRKIYERMVDSFGR